MTEGEHEPAPADHADDGPEPLPSNKPKGRRKLTRMQERLARAIVRDPDATLGEVGQAAGYAKGRGKERAAISAWRASNQPHVKERIRELMNLRPATSLKGLHKTLEEGLRARETKFFAHKGKVKSTKHVVNHDTRHKYLETALELHGALEKDAKGAGVTNNFFTKEAMETFVDAFKGRAPQQLAPEPPPGDDGDRP